MILTTVTIRRGTGPIANQAVIASNVPAQIDQKSLDMQNFDKGAAPYDLFSIYAWTNLIARNDHLMDENDTAMIYTVSARPETFLDGHVELDAFLPVGS